jgi:hypothetical protein
MSIKTYTIHIGQEPPPRVDADSAEEAVMLFREVCKDQGVYLPVPWTVHVTADDFDAEVTV